VQQLTAYSLTACAVTKILAICVHLRPKCKFLYYLITAGATRKPNSVSVSGYPETDNDHSSKDADCSAPHATYPGARAGSPQTLPYLVLHRVGFAKLPRSPGELVRSYRTFSPLPCRSGAVYFLLHFPSRRRDSTLWSTLPCGVRTFLRT